MSSTGILSRPSRKTAPDSVLDDGSLIDRFLAEQSRLTTAVSRFSQWHDSGTHDPLLRKSYQDLIPLSRPGHREQYAFQVDLDVCSGCKACVTACHNLNGLDTEEIWREVGLLHMRDQEHSLQQTVTTACHHCADPACSNGCPVLAYDKDEETGIVRHLDDQCIGCQYCILKCPYDVPKYNKSLGIVRKCDMCHSRLSAGEAPACVQSCPNQAIRIVKVTRNEIEQASSSSLVPGAFDSSYTLPSTRYLTTRENAASLQPADSTSLRIEHTHFPLVIMLVLTQAAVGSLLANGLHLMTGGSSNIGLSTSAAVLALGGLSASVLHLGRPLQAWRAFLGWKKSWLSREILSFGLWFPLVTLSLILTLLPTLNLTHSHLFLLQSIILSTVCITGILSVFCSIMVYADTRRPFWSLPLSTGKFAGTVCILGSAFAAIFTRDSFWLQSAALCAGLKLGFESLFLLIHLPSDPQHPQTRSARVLWQLHKPWTLARFTSTLLGTTLLWLEPVSGTLLLLVGEILERILFFRAVTAPRMPGALS